MDRLRQEVTNDIRDRRASRDVHRDDIVRMVSRSIYRERHTKNFRFFCPFCSTPRRLGMHPRPGQPIHFAQVGLTSLIFTLATWSLFGIKGLVSFIPFWMIFEMLYRMKVRASLNCGNCGFDPVLYLTDVERAKKAIRDHWEARRGQKDRNATGQVREESSTEEVEEFEPNLAENAEEEQSAEG